MNVRLFARAGGTNAVVVELSECHARVQHRNLLRGGSEVPLIFDWGDSWFVATTRVMSATSIDASGMFESELQFVNIPEHSKETLDAAISTLGDARLEQSLAEIVASALAGASSPCDLLRCRFIAGKWIVRNAKADELPPVDGFIVPSSVGDAELTRLRAAYETLDNDGRQMLRLLAAARLAA
ncbi:MAG TPA: hypothetical protein VI391_01085 [Thermoanaerobaculia bacterium]